MYGAPHYSLAVTCIVVHSLFWGRDYYRHSEVIAKRYTYDNLHWINFRPTTFTNLTTKSFQCVTINPRQLSAAMIIYSSTRSGRKMDMSNNYSDILHVYFNTLVIVCGLEARRSQCGWDASWSRRVCMRSRVIFWSATIISPFSRVRSRVQLHDRQAWLCMATVPSRSVKVVIIGSLRGPVSEWFIPIN